MNVIVIDDNFTILRRNKLRPVRHGLIAACALHNRVDFSNNMITTQPHECGLVVRRSRPCCSLATASPACRLVLHVSASFRSCSLMHADAALMMTGRDSASNTIAHIAPTLFGGARKLASVCMPGTGLAARHPSHQPVHRLDIGAGHIIHTLRAMIGSDVCSNAM